MSKTRNLADVASGTITGNLSFSDNEKAILGDGDDLQIYHNGSDSYVRDEGTGSLVLQGTSQVKIQSPVTGENYAVFNDDGAVTLNYNNSLKFATSATGVTVTGTVAATSYTGDGSNLTGIASSFNSSTSWASVSRSSGTTYTNSLSYPIMFKVTGGVNGYISVTVNGVQIHSMTAAYSNRETVTVIVPPGKTYSFSGSSIQGTWILS